MRGERQRELRYGSVRVALALIGVSALSGCVQTREVAAPSSGHPAYAESASVTFAPPDNLFAHPLEQVGDHNAAQPAMDMPGMSGMDHGDAGDSGLTVYTCPMHADVRSDRPGTCPQCGMQLVPNHKSDQPHKHGGAP